MNSRVIAGLITAVLAGTAAAFEQLPYPWAHTVTFGISVGIAALHVPVPSKKSAASVVVGNPKGE